LQAVTIRNREWPQKVEVGYMKVICPKCQYENQADSSRVVCARCATIIEVRMDQGSGLDNNGKRQTARLPFASNTPSSGSQPLSSQPLNQNRDVYATRVGDDFEDVLDIPRPSPTSYPTAAESAPVFEDVFAPPSYDSTSAYDFSAYEKNLTTPIDSFQAGTPRQRETQDYVESPEPEFMGWPVLPENSVDEEETAGSGRGGLFMRIGLIVAVFAVLVALTYYFLWDIIAKRKGQENNLASTSAQVTNQGAPVPATSPLAAPNSANNSGAATNNAGAADAPKTSITPPIVAPKPADQAPANPKSGKEVVIQPEPGLVGRSGPSQLPKPAPTAPPAAPVNRGNLTVQIGSFNDQAQANERAARLKSGGADARVVRADIPGKGTWYRVQVGGFASREEAMIYGNQLKAKNLTQDFIVTTVGK
jgi:cell division septation protein DedD